ncbi:MAG TPA: gamma-glutamylcyclotransferase [Candidatus Sumerlaeota bacterium]|nr:gamma-glutamylcyclotransferase [Candidatus Sumerlaeota bacterium]
MKSQESLWKNTTPHDTQQHQTISIFAYGTLKSGFWNHDRFCRNAISIQPATTWGRLYELPAGYPALEVPEEHILAHGTSDPLADAATQARLITHMPPHATNRSPTGDWDRIHGELITFPDPLRDLPPIDRLEGFSPGTDFFYHRIMVRSQVNGTIIPAWVFVNNTDPCRHRFLPCGRWPS